MNKSYFPIRIRIVSTGQEKVIDWEELPNREAFVVLETNVEKKNTPYVYNGKQRKKVFR